LARLKVQPYPLVFFEKDNILKYMQECED